jgi:pyrroloquinoline-quinone synthase
MSSLIKKIDELIEERSLLKHPFYQMWSEGKLSLDSLKGYSKEYYQLVKAVPSFMTPLIKKAPAYVIDELVENQHEEIEHIKPWISFAGALGVQESDLEKYTGLEKTQQAVTDLSILMNSFEEGACAMYAFEKEIPKISQVKLDGLAEFYGISSEEATEYFRLHTEADIRHAATWRKIISSSTQEENLLQLAKRSLSAQNLLLDSCYETYC